MSDPAHEVRQAAGATGADPPTDLDRLTAYVARALAAWDRWEVERSLPRAQRHLICPPAVARQTLREMARTMPRPARPHR